MRELRGQFLLWMAASIVLALFVAACAPASTVAPSLTPQPTSSPTLPAIGAPAATTTRPQPTAVSSKAFFAYASGLASTFTKGAICTLEQPFVLEGDAPPVSSGLVARFTPTSPTTGNYMFSLNVSGCVDSSSGTYAVTFYTTTEGDIIMTGLHTRVCGGVTVASFQSESRIAIRQPGPVC